MNTGYTRNPDYKKTAREQIATLARFTSKGTALAVAKEIAVSVRGENNPTHMFVRKINPIVSDIYFAQNLTLGKFRSEANPAIDTSMFTELVGREPINDDLERVNCKKAGEVAHTTCGFSWEHNKPIYSVGPSAWQGR